ncbi:MAG: endolytic transglycosylase MltG [Minisyncoccia bacterium]
MDTLERFLTATLFALSSHLRRYFREWIALVLALASFGFSLQLLLSAPEGFPVNSTVVIERGAALPTIARELAQERIIAHPIVLEAIVRVLGGAGSAQAGAYRFAAPENAFTVALRLLSGQSDIPDVRITFIEGESVRQMATQVAAAFPLVSASDFIAAAGPYEGYLFPDTYRFSPDASAADIVSKLHANFDTKFASIDSQTGSSSRSISDIVIMASIIQDEASDPTEQQIVSGVLWNRITRGMPLQVDAPFGYLEDKPEHAPTLSELAINSPYNTYKYPGLPPTPIGNPGLSALTAAASPATTPYLYYLSGTDGLMYYSTTYAGQLANERKYLK